MPHGGTQRFSASECELSRDIPVTECAYVNLMRTADIAILAEVEASRRTGNDRIKAPRSYALFDSSSN
jgi:hypothetical protein